jgi:hypothetical protein
MMLRTPLDAQNFASAHARDNGLPKLMLLQLQITTTVDIDHVTAFHHVLPEQTLSLLHTRRTQPNARSCGPILFLSTTVALRSASELLKNTTSSFSDGMTPNEINGIFMTSHLVAMYIKATTHHQ